MCAAVTTQSRFELMIAAWMCPKFPFPPSYSRLELIAASGQLEERADLLEIYIEYIQTTRQHR
jgi:hypothetical protein